MTGDRHQLEGSSVQLVMERHRDRRRRHCEPAYTRLVATRRQTYAAAGVSLATGEAVVARLRAAVESTGATGFGAFAGLHPLDDHRLLAASTDSVGTKLVARPRAGCSCGRAAPTSRRTASTT